MAPPPVRIIPLSMMSELSSGGVSSSTARTAPMIASSGSVIASVTSLAWIWIVRGSPATSSRPRTSIRMSSSSGIALPIAILTSSAVRSPIRRLYLRLM
jgi:Na+/H+ antiporter NhaA